MSSDKKSISNESIHSIASSRASLLKSKLFGKREAKNNSPRLSANKQATLDYLTIR